MVLFRFQYYTIIIIIIIYNVSFARGAIIRRTQNTRTRAGGDLLLHMRRPAPRDVPSLTDLYTPEKGLTSWALGMRTIHNNNMFVSLLRKRKFLIPLTVVKRVIRIHTYSAYMIFIFTSLLYAEPETYAAYCI